MQVAVHTRDSSIGKVYAIDTSDAVERTQDWDQAPVDFTAVKRPLESGTFTEIEVGVLILLFSE